MAWLDRLLGRPQFIEDWSSLSKGLVELEGTVGMIEPLIDPLTGDSAVAVEYRAWPPSTMIGVDGAAAQAFLVRASAAAEFLLEHDGMQLLVVPPKGDDIEASHRELLATYGVNVEVRSTLVVAGDRVRVVGTVDHVNPIGSPHRADPYRAVIRAKRFWLPS